VRVLILAALFVALGSASEVNASHYSWLGHSGEVTADARALGSFAPTFYRILDEAALEWSPGERSDELLTQKGQLIARVTSAFKAFLARDRRCAMTTARWAHFSLWRACRPLRGKCEGPGA